MRSCKKGRYAPPVHMIKLTQEREITPYVWVHPNEDNRQMMEPVRLPNA